MFKLGERFKGKSTGVVVAAAKFVFLVQLVYRVSQKTEQETALTFFLSNLVEKLNGSNNSLVIAISLCEFSKKYIYSDFFVF